MLTALYSFLLRRRGAAYPPEIARQMLDDFQEARDDARRQGIGAYLGFGVRELTGIVWPASPVAARSSRPNRLRWVATFAIAGGVVAGVIAYSKPPQYISSAMLRVVSPSISEGIVPSLGRTEIRRQFYNQVSSVLSRRTLSEMINVYNLYSSERTRMPLEDVIERMRRDIAVANASEDTIRISFISETPGGAQRVARDLMTRLIDNSIRHHQQELKTLSMFLSERSEATANEWMAAGTRLRSLKDGTLEWQKAAMDLDLARKDYEGARAKLSQARTAEAAANWKYEATLEVLDLPSLPEQELLNRPLMVMTGVVAGMLAGLLLSWLRSVRPVNPMISAPTSA